MRQLRRDGWSNLEEASSRLAGRGIRSDRASGSGARVAGHVGTDGALLGFPGRRRFQEVQRLRDELHRMRRPEDEFVYELVVVPSFTDAVTAVLFNFTIQACVIRRRFGHRSQHDLSALGVVIDEQVADEFADQPPDIRAQVLGRRLHDIRPEIDLYLMAEVAVEEIAGRLGQDFRRVFHAREGLLELHLNVLRGVAHRYRAPFFAAACEYSHKLTGVFHALPVSRGKSVVDSHWIQEMVSFYGLEIFLAETSATCGGLDSLLEPTGPASSTGSRC